MAGDKIKIAKKINKLVKEYFCLPKEKTEKIKIPLNIPNYSWPEVNEAIESLLSTYVTMGEKVFRFEKMFAE